MNKALIRNSQLVIQLKPKRLLIVLNVAMKTVQDAGVVSRAKK